MTSAAGKTFANDSQGLAIPSNEEHSVPQIRMMLREVETTIGRQISPDERNRL
jgi:uncharacterized membrane protein